MSSSVASEPDITQTCDPAFTDNGRALRDRPHEPVQTSSALTVLLLSALFLLPFWTVPLAHVLGSAETATGLFHYELPYYVANGRAAFERGDGLFYPNPYDPAANAPVIYAHWLPWILGWLTARLGADPGDSILMLTFFASLLFAVTTRMVVRQRLYSLNAVTSGSECVAWMAAMWGGGLLALAGLLLPPASAPNWTESALRFDPGNGLWFLNWGRNSLFPTEAIYHSLVALCWVFELRGRRLASTGWLLLLATTHPWSGIELLLTISFWRTLQWLKYRDRSSAGWWILAIGAMGCFLAYYKLWLPSFPQHAELQSVWELDWSLQNSTASLAYGPIALAGLLHVKERLRSRSWTTTDSFLISALAVAAGLAFHDRLIKPVQPLHFTRGYVWMPLFLLGLPKLVTWWQSAWSASAQKRLLAIAAVLLLCADNAAFSLVHGLRQFRQRDGFHLSVDERALLAELPRKCPEAIILTDSETLNYLAPTYGSVRPWLGHKFNTPRFPIRHERFLACFPPGRVEASQIPPDVDAVAVRRERDASSLVSSGEWADCSISNATWTVWRRLSDNG